MPFIPHTSNDVQEMLATIGVATTETLFDEIPQNLLQAADISTLASGMTEMELTRHMQERARLDAGLLCFIGAGAYEHHIPAAVWEVTSRGEFLTAYTPYQAEASQGTLQLLYEYQTMMASLMALDVSNASLYDGASALAEAVLMAVRSNKQKYHPRVLIPRSVHPYYRRVLKTIVGQQDIELLEVPIDTSTGCVDMHALEKLSQEVTALIIPQPNFFGVLEDVDALTNWAHKHNAIAIAQVNPLAMSLLKAPGQWGVEGADIACGEGQPLGVPLASGGPYYGFLCCKKEYVRQLPGRIVGRTVDANGKPGFVLTLQAREQHIRRAKATSNICTNQGLLVTASTIYMSLMGPKGLRRIAETCYANAELLKTKLAKVPGVDILFKEHSFHEMVLRCARPVEQILNELAGLRIQAGFAISAEYPELGNALLVCVTETKTEQDLDVFVSQLSQVLNTSARKNHEATEKN